MIEEQKINLENNNLPLALIRDICKRVAQVIEEIEGICDEEEELSEKQDEPPKILQGIGLFYFVQEEEPKIKEKFPSFTDNQVLNIVVAQWEKLSMKDKNQYSLKINPQKMGKSKELIKVNKIIEKALKNIEENNDNREMFPQLNNFQIGKILEERSNSVERNEPQMNEEEKQAPVIANSIEQNNQHQVQISNNNVRQHEPLIENVEASIPQPTNNDEKLDNIGGQIQQKNQTDVNNAQPAENNEILEKKNIQENHLEKQQVLQEKPCQVIPPQQSVNAEKQEQIIPKEIIPVNQEDVCSEKKNISDLKDPKQIVEVPAAQKDIDEKEKKKDETEKKKDETEKKEDEKEKKEDEKEKDALQEESVKTPQE